MNCVVRRQVGEANRNAFRESVLLPALTPLLVHEDWEAWTKTVTMYSPEQDQESELLEKAELWEEANIRRNMLRRQENEALAVAE